MINKGPARRFEPIFKARREYEELRRGLGRALAEWTAGTVDFIAIMPAVEAFETAHRHLIETIYAHRFIGSATQDDGAPEEVRAMTEASQKQLATE